MSFLSRLLGKNAPEDKTGSNALTGNDAARLLHNGQLGANAVVEGKIKGIKYGSIEVPAGLTANGLDLSGLKVTLNPGLKIRHLILNRAQLANGLPADLQCEQLDAIECNLSELPAGIVASQRINLSNCGGLKKLPNGLKTGSLVLRDCKALETLPEGLDVNFLDISNCSNIRALPSSGSIRLGRLIARNCSNLETLPPWLDQLSGLDLQNCEKIGRLPETLYISAWLDIAGTGITQLPQHLANVGLRWRGVPVDARIVFHPETLGSNDILLERNAEVRRVMLERVGFERFVELANAKILDSDFDKGGERKLLKVLMPDDEDLVCVSFSCPSTGRKYVVRVPPATKTAHAAVAWIAGFDNPNDYKPDLES